MPDERSLAERARALRQEALETLDLALAAAGTQRALLLELAVRLRDDARTLDLVWVGTPVASDTD